MDDSTDKSIYSTNDNDTSKFSSEKSFSSSHLTTSYDDDDEKATKLNFSKTSSKFTSKFRIVFTICNIFLFFFSTFIFMIIIIINKKNEFVGNGKINRFGYVYKFSEYNLGSERLTNKGFLYVEQMNDIHDKYDEMAFQKSDDLLSIGFISNGVDESEEKLEEKESIWDCWGECKKKEDEVTEKVMIVSFKAMTYDEVLGKFKKYGLGFCGVGEEEIRLGGCDRRGYASDYPDDNVVDFLKDSGWWECFITCKVLKMDKDTVAGFHPYYEQIYVESPSFEGCTEISKKKGIELCEEKALSHQDDEGMNENIVIKSVVDSYCFSISKKPDDLHEESEEEESY